MLINCIPQVLNFVSPEGNIFATLPAAETPATAVRGPAKAYKAIDVGIPVVGTTAFTAVTGLPLSGNIIVPLVVAEAMRTLHIEHPGKVYSPQPLVFKDNKPVGTPGLIRHFDLEDLV